ncbi:50S ribosomal protein L18e [archaeon]|jgi:large subunit ribosomal protein L18e|nr:50S ribosomal protein L18e [archaeon]MBT4416911.1 50S ribosomal protein L18e [archaeon]
MKTDLQKRELIANLKKTKINVWKAIATELEKSTKRTVGVNIAKIIRHTREGETALIPGKVLSLGKMEKKLTVAAYNFSDKAKEKINKNGKALTIKELLKTNPKGNKVRILK